MIRFILSLQVFLASFFVSYAQSDFIITSKGDTLLGELRSSNDNWVKFKGKEQSKFQKLPSIEVKEVYSSFDDAHYAYKVVKLGNSPIRLARLRKGKINLYERRTYTYTQYGSSTNVNWYAEKDGHELVEIKTNSFWGSREARKNAFSQLIADQPTILEIFNKEEKFSFKFLDKLIEQYNAL